MKVSINDLGIGAYLMMNGFKVVGRKGRNVFFEVETDKDKTELDAMAMDYLRTDYERFDNYLAVLKKISESANLDAAWQSVSDLGIGAYLMLKGHKVSGRKGKNVYFEVLPSECESFRSMQIEYLGGAFHTFDAYLMALKKMGDL